MLAGDFWYIDRYNPEWGPQEAEVTIGQHGGFPSPFTYPVRSDPYDDMGHGTHIAGIIAGDGNNARGITGVCPECKVMGVKFLNEYGYGLLDDGFLAIDYAVSHGANVLSNSWGSPQYSQALQDVINEAEQNGIVIIAAAGNSNNQVPMYPADMENVISVAATDRDDKKSSYSTYGSWLDLSAPGGDIDGSCQNGLSVFCKFNWWPDCCRYPPPLAILSTISQGTFYDCWNEVCDINNQGDHYSGMAGTSMAAPYVSGVAGLLLSKYPTWTNHMVEDQLKRTTDDISAQNPGYQGLLGTGRLNAYNALSHVCSGNIPKGYCSSQKPLYCTGTALVNNCQICSCPGSSTCLADGTCSGTGGSPILKKNYLVNIDGSSPLFLKT
ncbi:MAG: S8 family serine peptidase [Nanoarchaeota archaeon]